MFIWPSMRSAKGVTEDLVIPSTTTQDAGFEGRDPTGVGEPMSPRRHRANTRRPRRQGIPETAPDLCLSESRSDDGRPLVVALRQALLQSGPYTIQGDIAGLMRAAGPYASEWGVEVERRRIHGFALMPSDHAAPRPATEHVRFTNGTAPADATVFTCLSSAFIATASGELTVTEDPVTVDYLRSRFWELWDAAAGHSPGPATTKSDHMKLPDLALRSDWVVPDSILQEARESQEAMFLLNLTRVRDAYLEITELLPEISVRYSIKTNPDPQVLRLLRDLGSGFEVTSFAEVELALEAGASPDVINFSAPVKRRADLRRAYEVGVRLYTVDSYEEARKIAQTAPGVSCIVRVRTRGENGAHIPLSTKFGVEPTEVLPLMEAIRDLGLIPRGIGFHVGGQNEVVSAWQESLAEVHQILNDLRAQHHEIDIVNIGGGFPILVKPFVPELEQIAPLLRAELTDLTYLSEPGRLVVADAGKLITPVVSRTTRGGRSWLYINASLFGTLQMMDRHGFYFPVTTDHAALDLEEYVISSLSCDGRDVISYGTVLPKGINEGDLLVFHFVGAYSAPVFDIPYGGVSTVGIRYLG